ncbi:hypothetical protein ILYODFUR_009489 [Ilyodon furcidens]|uniref:Scaffolding anchor of CK1 domain-containing protein n=1 Tax=Ilyodon furcidens TaxID=33524 RepID=A0ABV0T9F1_9TELE
MALSQIQCFDDNHVNPRIHEAKPEFFYCEEQRLALEALFQDGRDAFVKYLESRGLRGFLSDLELEALTAALEPFDPHSELFSGEAEDEPEPLSLQYWPEVSDTSIPQMDLGWPNSDSYRGVTRTSVYTQPPMEGQAHIKEVVRKMIAQAQKMIAVVMDVFTDVDIFRDLLDAGFKRKVCVYILLERTMLPHFLSMCRRASMHAGHLKHLRVRCTDGTEFYTRYSTKVRGQMGHRFMFIDGDKAVSGSYSFTWRSSRLDRNLITVTTGQAVDTFDQLFRFLYTSSSFVELRQVAAAPEPEPDTRHQVLSVAPPSAAIARKLYNPKYALVALSSPSPVNSSGHDSPKEPEISEDPKNKKKRKRIHEELPQNAPPLHPGLINLEKANLISYLPIWPEPDPPRDVIGFINIRDSKKTAQVHLQRSEMFETSQAIKFSCPISNPQETLPEVAMPRKVTAQNLTSQTTRKESQLPAAVVHTPTPKGLPKGILPTPDSRTTSPDPRTSTPDYSDGYFSPREDSALSTPSEEYFECIESPSHEPVLDTSGYRNHGIRENDSIAYSGSPFSKDIGTSPADLDNIPSAAALDSASQSISCNESSTLAWTAGDPSASLRKVTNKTNSKEAAKIEVKSSDTGKKKAPEYQSKEGTDNKEFNQMPGTLKDDSDLREINLKLSKASGRLVDGGMTDGESMQKEPNRLSTGEPKPERVLSEGKKTPSGIEKPLNQAAPTPSNMEIRQRQHTKETTGHKSLHPSPKSQPHQQPGSRGSSPSRPLKSSRPLSGSQVQRARPSGIRDLNQTESRALPSNLKLSDNKPPSRRSQSRSPSPMKVVPIGAASGRKQVSQSQPHQLARQPPAAQIRSKPDYQQSQTTKPQSSNLKPRVHTHASTEEVSEQAAHELEEARGPFNLSFGKFYNFKGLRDKWTKLPTQSRRSSTGTPVKERKSTS